MRRRNLEAPPTFRCTCCKQELPLEAFSKTSRKAGDHTRCRACTDEHVSGLRKPSAAALVAKQPPVPTSAPAPSAANGALRVGTLNVHGWVAEDGEYNSERIGALLGGASLDVACLQEVLPDFRERGANVLQRVAAAAGLRHTCWHGRSAILSRHELRRPVLAHHPQLGGALGGEIGRGGHVRPSDAEERRKPWHRLLLATVAVDGSPLVVGW